MTIQKTRQKMLELLALSYPEALTELEYTNGFQLLIAVVMSAQTTDVAVNKVTKILYQHVTSPQDILKMGYDTLAEYIKSIGLWRTKALNLMRLSQILLDKHQGEIPSDRAALCALPGVGTKTASVVLNVLFNHPTVAVDTHVFRVAHRTHLAHGKTPDLVEKYFMTHYNDEQRFFLHHRLILHGRYVCKARHPQCVVCILQNLCPSRGLYVAE